VPVKWALTSSSPTLFKDGFEHVGALIWSAAFGLDE
jgi:hypothetical protein